MKDAPVMLALVTDAFGGQGGIAQYNRDLLSAVAKTETASIVVLPRLAPGRVVLPPGIVQIRPRLGRIAYAFAAVGAVLFRRVDVVFCGHLYMAVLGAIIARLARAKLIVQAHGIETWTCPSGLRRAAVERSDLVLSVSRYTRACVLGWAAIEPERLVVLPNTVGEGFTPGNTRAWPAGKQVLLTVGRLDERERYKGHDRVISAIPHLVAGGHDVAYLIVGEGTDRARLEKLADKLGVADRVRFLGAVGLQALIDAYRMADLFVMPSTGEGFGIAFLEAMACGAPALGLGLAGAIDALGDGELGAAVAERDLITALSKLLRSPRPDPAALASAVRRRFGRDQFTLHARAVLRRLMEAA